MKRFNTFRISRTQWIALAILASSATLGYAVDIPNSFSSGGTADAAQVNANFTALKTAVDALETKTGSGSVAVSFDAFHETNGATAATCAFVRGVDYGRFEGTGADCVARAGISLPHGATLTGLHCTLFDNATGVAESVNAYLDRVSLSGAEYQEVYATASTVDSTNAQMLSDTTPNGTGSNLVDNNSFAYRLYVSFSTSGSNFTTIGGNLRLYGCRVSYE